MLKPNRPSFEKTLGYRRGGIRRRRSHSGNLHSITEGGSCLDFVPRVSKRGRKLSVASQVLRFSILSLLLLGVTVPSGAEPSASKVGRVLDIDGDVLMTNRLSDSGWFEAFPMMSTYMHERMRSDKNTSATLEFAIGGQAIIAPGSEIEIVAQRDIEAVGNKVILKVGAMWATMDKQKAQVQIQTGGGVIGIEGTEFFVEVDANGETKLTLLEGQVTVTNIGGESRTLQGSKGMQFGQKGLRPFNLPPDVLEALRQGDRQSARELIAESLKFGHLFQRALRKHNYRRAAHRKDPRRRPQGDSSLREVFQVTEKAHVSKVDSGRESRVRSPEERRARWRGRRPEGLDVRESIPGVAQNLRVEGQRPIFGWDPVPGAGRYAVFLTSDAESDHLIWSAQTDSTTVQYPIYGPDLAEGDYSWRVLPIGPDDSATIKKEPDAVAQASFHTSGFSGSPIALKGARVDAASGPPDLQWEKVPGASSYEVLIANDEMLEDLVWSGSSEAASYSYPLTARSLGPGTYFVRVDAFDEFGAKMGGSEVRSFTSVEWEAQGLKE